MVKEDPTGTSAAIASVIAAEIQGLDILARSIEDRQDNTTRFMILRKGVDPAAANSVAKTKSLITFTVDHQRPGALSSVLDCFQVRGINLTSINSRPTRIIPFQYIFFVEFEGSKLNADGDKVKDVLAALDKFVITWRWLGSWDDKLVGKEWKTD